MSMIEMAILLGFGIPLVLLTGLFIVLMTWLQVNEELAHAQSEA